jgi:hypothetical protein
VKKKGMNFIERIREKWAGLSKDERAYVGFLVSGAMMLGIAVIVWFVLGGVLAPSMIEMTNSTTPLTDADAISMRADAITGLQSNYGTISLVFFMAGMILIIVGLIQAFAPMFRSGRGGAF